MKASKFIIASAGLACLLLMSSCGGKGRDGGGDPQPPPPPPPPPMPTSIYSDYYDNVQGMNPLASIRGTPIRNVTFALQDRAGTDSPLSSQTILTFDSQGLLSSVSSIDIAGWLSNSFSGSFDPWNRFNHNPMPTSQLVTFTARNIPYRYSNSSGKIVIGNYIAGSSVPAQGPQAIPQGVPGGQLSRMAVTISASSAAYSSKLFSFNLTYGNIEGRQEYVGSSYEDSTDYGGQGSGFRLKNKIIIRFGSLVGSQIPTITYTNTTFQQGPPVLRESFISTSPNYFIYRRPVLDPQM